MSVLSFDSSSTFGGATQSFGIGTAINQVTAAQDDFLMQVIRLQATGPDATVTVPSGWTAIGSEPLTVTAPTGTYPNRAEYLYLFSRFYSNGVNGPWSWTINNVGTSTRLGSTMFLVRVRNVTPPDPPTIVDSVAENTAGPSTTNQAPAFSTTAVRRNIFHVSTNSRASYAGDEDPVYVTANGFTAQFTQSNARTMIGWRTAAVAGIYDMPVVSAKNDQSVSEMFLSKTFALSYGVVATSADEWGVNAIRW